MNIKQIILAAAVLSATGAAFAEAAYPVEQNLAATKTRAEVAAEVAQAHAAKLSQGGVKFNNLYAGH